MRRARRLFVAALFAMAGSAVLVIAAWAVDTSRSQGEVARNVTLAGRDVSGLDQTELAAVVKEVARAYSGESIEVREPGGGGFSMTPAEIGLTVDEEATIAAALDTGRTGSAFGRLVGWVGSFTGDRTAKVAVKVDGSAVRRVVAERDAGRTPPTEPSVRSEKGRLVAVDGTSGRGIDPAAVLQALPEAAARRPIRLDIERGPVLPRFDMVDAERLVGTGEKATSKALAVTVDGQPAEVPAAKLRSWLRGVVTDQGLRLGVDTVRATEELGELLPDAGQKAVDASFTVADNVPRIVPGTPGTACCAPDAGAQIDAAIQARLAGRSTGEPLTLPLRRRDPDFTVEEAEELGIREPVATFTTNHAPNQPRVTNIHNISDLVRGQVIHPGKTFSVNGFVGERTTEKGFVVDHVIEDGRFAEAVGGGISQFATTTFNAAFFAGLEFPEYQSHSLYISRYPYGREATLSFPHPDLKIRNPSPYGVLIWPTYTGRSVTVTLYSTKWVEVTQSAQSQEQRGPCVRVRTERTRRSLADGTTRVDSVRALYRPEEGVNCPG